MAKTKNSEAYFRKIVRNSYKNEYRSNDNFFKHISSVGDESDIQQESIGKSDNNELNNSSIERQLYESNAENWPMFMENCQLHASLSALSTKDIQFLFFIFVLRYSNIEIATAFELTPNIVAKQKKRLIEKVRKIYFQK